MAGELPLRGWAGPGTCGEGRAGKSDNFNFEKVIFNGDTANIED